MLKFSALPLAWVMGIGLSFAYGQGSPQLVHEAQWEEGKRYLAQGKGEEAREIFAGLLKRYPREADLHLFLGLALLKLRDPQGAERHIRRALVLAPDHAEARTLLGWIELEVRRDYAAAIEHYAAVAQLRPNFPEAYNNLGVAWKKKGELDRAVENFSRALELRPDYGEAWSNRGWVYVERKKWREALSDFEQALRIRPQDEGALYGLSHVLRQRRDYAGAQRALKQIMARSPNFVYWLEWGELELVRYYWVLLVVVGGFFVHARWKRLGGGFFGNRGTKKA